MGGVRRADSTNGVTVAVHDLGGQGPPLLLAHATGFHAQVLAPMAAHLADRFHCWAFDQRAHGRSTAPADGDFHWRGLADDALATVAALGLDRPFGFGHSSGGAALLLAEAGRPGTFRGLFCYEPVVLPFDPPLGRDAGMGPEGQGNPLAAGALRRRDRFASRAEARANYAGKPPFAAFAPEVVDAYVEHGLADQPDGTVALRCRPEHEAEMYRMGSAHDAFGRLPGIACPVTIACGNDGGHITPEVGQAIVDRLPAGRLLVMDGLGHFGPLQDPAGVAAAVVTAFEV
jgi:pimeloyl-ACP methyl ester carboxylesterase